MTSIRASAPGKVIVAGEYAVLDGAPAICMAINRRAQVAIVSSSDNQHSVVAPGFRATPQRFESIADSDREFPLLANAWRMLAAKSDEYFSIEIDSRAFFSEQSGKLGIGSSAAVAAALTAALNCLSGESRDVAATAMRVHREFQGGKGSGVDVAGSCAGGVIEYRMGEAAVDRGWPAGLHYALLWSGKSADTGRQLDKLASGSSRSSRAELGDVASQVAVAWRGATVEAITAVLGEYTAVLRRFDIDHQLGIFDAGHATLEDLAGGGEVVYKPCGAGGGDLGMALSGDASALDEFIVAAQARNFERLALAIDSTGVVAKEEKVD